MKKRVRPIGSRLYGFGLLLVGVIVLILCWPLFQTFPEMVSGAVRTESGDIPANHVALAVVAAVLGVCALASLLMGLGMLVRRPAGSDALRETEE